MFGRQKRDEHLDQIARLSQQCSDATEAAVAYMAEVTELRQENGSLHRLLEEAQGTLTVIQASLGEVAVYKGMGIGRESVVLYLNELVRDHEELERRIDLAMLECASAMDGDSVQVGIFAQGIGRTLQGGSKTPDTIEEIDEA
jgi:hypothetical protein